MPKGETAAGKHEAGVAGRKCDGHPGGHESAPAGGGEDEGLARIEIRPGVTLVCVGRDGQVGIEPDERYLEHAVFVLRPAYQ